MLHVITPSRGRPGNAERLQQALRQTCTGEWHLWLGVDDDDPTRAEYDALTFIDLGTTTVMTLPRKGLMEWTNLLAAMANGAGAKWLASLGDDHLPRTAGWDKKLIGAIQAMDGPGWAYGDDLLRGEGLPTAWVQSAELVRVLDWMMLPGCEHLYVDAAVLDLGRAAGRIAYLPDVVVEHMHAAAGKAPDDDLYKAANSARRIRDDSRAYTAWMRSPQFAKDVAAVRSLTWEA